MNNIFPSYTTSFLCNCTTQEAMERISKAVACQGNYLDLVKAYYIGVQKIRLDAHTGSYLYCNSFMPTIDIEILDQQEKTQICAIFQLKKSTKVLMTICYVFLILFEITLLVHQISHQQTLSVQLFYPLGIMLLQYFFSVAGMFFSSKGVLRILFTALTSEDEKLIPCIHWSKNAR